jgi:hypothetical protein
MILRTFDNGWGSEFRVKQFENQLFSDIAQRLNMLPERVVIINSTWYTDDYHNSTVLPFLRNNLPNRIILVAMLDPAIPKPNWFQEFNCQVDCIGYYNSPGNIDFWALFMNQHFETPSVLDLTRIDKIDRAFMCLNRKPHHHRLAICKELENFGLVNKGLVTLGSESDIPVYSLTIDSPEVYGFSPQTGSQNFGMPGDITTLGSIKNWRRHFLNIVTETIYDVDKEHFVSEKIYKPILGHRPFLVYAPSGATHWLTSRGFETYCDDFKDISDLDLTVPENIAPFLFQLCNQPICYLQKKLLDLNQKILYNKQQFYRHVDKELYRIKKELYA